MSVPKAILKREKISFMATADSDDEVLSFKENDFFSPIPQRTGETVSSPMLLRFILMILKNIFCAVPI